MGVGGFGASKVDVPPRRGPKPQSDREVALLPIESDPTKPIIAVEDACIFRRLGDGRQPPSRVRRRLRSSQRDLAVMPRHQTAGSTADMVGG